MIAQSLAELPRLVERYGEARLEHRGRLLLADRDGIRIRFQMVDGLEGSVAAAWPSATIGSEDGRAQLLRAVNNLIQRCGMFEICERAYQKAYGRRTV